MKMMKKSAILIAFGMALILATGCSGGSGTSSGGSSTRAVTGNVSNPGGNVNQALMAGLAAVADDCSADTVMATDTSGNSTQASVSDDCSFSLTLDVGTSYVVSFLMEDEFVASLIFDTGNGDTTSVISVSDGSSAIGLGQITITGNVAEPASNPLSQCDEDDDGLDDYDDSDDDGDEVDDADEEDCDLDGYSDDDDSDDSDCEGDDNQSSGQIKDVKPRNDPHTDLGEDRVDLDKDIRARIHCTVDPSTVTAQTFMVESEDGEPLDCTFSFDETSSGTRITCDHNGFADDTVYTATLNGILCEDTTAVESGSWTWLTETEDDDEGCEEDDRDDELESDDDSGEDDEDDDDDDSEDDDD